MLAIRFQRTGRTKQPFYRVVVSEKTKDTQGKHLEILGSYNPRSKELSVKADKIKHWISKGAQASASVFNLLVKEGILEGKKMKSVSISKARTAKKVEAQKKEADLKAKEEAKKQEELAKAAEVTEAPAAPVADTSASEAETK